MFIQIDPVHLTYIRRKEDRVRDPWTSTRACRSWRPATTIGLSVARERRVIWKRRRLASARSNLGTTPVPVSPDIRIPVAGGNSPDSGRHNKAKPAEVRIRG